MSEMDRRSLLKIAGTSAGLFAFGAAAMPASEAPRTESTAEAGPAQAHVAAEPFDVDGTRVTVRTKTCTAVVDGGRLVSLVRRSDGREFVKDGDGKRPTLQLVYSATDDSPLGGFADDKVSVVRMSARRVEFRINGWYGDAVIAVYADDATGDVIIEPSAYSSRPGLRSCRWLLAGIAGDLELVAPFFQGVKLPIEDPLLGNDGYPWYWPGDWEAGYLIFEGADGGFWVHCRDTEYRYKTLRIGAKDNPRRIGFETESYGPLDGNLAAGGLAWRINTFSGDWKTPAAVYRDWLWDAWHLGEERRPEWLHEIRFALSWCPSDTAILDALATRIAPGKVLIHASRWRKDPYDEKYPTYVADEKGRAFLKRAREMGFHVMPHCNAVDMDPAHPVFPLVRDFRYRNIENGKALGWTWIDGGSRALPESNLALPQHPDKKTMVKIHNGLSMWRSILAENIGAAADDCGLEAVFLDVALGTMNLRNCLVENMTSSEGMNRVIGQVAALRDGLAVGGEGRNELTMQHLSLGQVHLFNSYQQNTEGLERTGGTPLNEFVFGRICRSFGYSALSGRNDAEALRMRTHVANGAIPTVTVRSASDITSPNAHVSEMLELATS
jgi:hypothetical protein